MNRSRPLALIVLAACLAGCVQSGAGLSPGSSLEGSIQSPAQTAATATGTPVETSSLPAGATASPGRGGGSAVPSPDPGFVTIGLQDGGKSVAAPIGATILVMLGTDFVWTVAIDDPSILMPVPGVTLVRGAQGLYRAQKAGQTTISAVGDPACRSSRPPCMAPSFHWSVTVDVR